MGGKRCYASARKIIVVTDSFKDRLMSRNVDPEKIEVVKNGVDCTVFFPVAKNDELLRRLQLNGKKIVGYIGTHGLAHRLDFILRCAKQLEGKNNYHFLFIGDGAEKEKLFQLKERLGLQNVTMLDSVSKREVKEYISILDVALVNLKKSDLFTTVIPSKIFENAAMEVPVLLGVNGEARRIIEFYKAGLCFEPESEADFICQLELLLSNQELYNRCKDGCRRLARDFDRRVLADKMLDVLLDVL